MIEKPEQYYDTRRHQLYYQWRESEHHIHREPIYDRTRNYIESLDAENAKLRELCSALYEFAYDEYPDSAELNFADRMRKLRIEVEHD